MATQAPDRVNAQMDFFSPEEKQWLNVSLQNQIKSLERMMAKYPPGSGAYAAHQKDVESLRAIKSRIG